MPPVTILHVCVGNICRSPMAERLLAYGLRKRLGDEAETRYVNHGAGTGSWHVGEPMSDGAARQITGRGGDPANFRARRISGDLIDTADLILTATSEQVAYVLDLRPDAADRTFTLREFGRLLADVDLDALPPAADPHARAVALIEAVDGARLNDDGTRQPSRGVDNLADPYGMPDREFARAADTIEAITDPVADALIG